MSNLWLADHSLDLIFGAAVVVGIGVLIFTLYDFTRRRRRPADDPRRRERGSWKAFLFGEWRR